MEMRPPRRFAPLDQVCPFLAVGPTQIFSEAPGNGDEVICLSEAAKNTHIKSDYVLVIQGDYTRAVFKVAELF